MKKWLIIFALAMAIAPARAGLIFDNGAGDKNDTLVIQFCLLDSAGLKCTTWDTAYIVQAYGGVDFNTDTLVSPSSCDLNSVYPRNLMFEYRLLAGDSTTGHLGPYTWWAHLVDSNNGADSHQMHYGNYYVNADPLEDLLAAADTAAGAPLGKLGRDIVGDSIPSMQNFNEFAGDIDSLQIADSAIDSAALAAGFYRAMRRYIWRDTLANYPNPSMDEAGYRLRRIYDFADGNGLDGIDADIAAISASIGGSGSESCTLFVKQDSISPIQGARIVIKTLDQTAVRIPGAYTNVNGRVIVQLDTADYFISIAANNYVPFADTLDVTTDFKWSFNMTLFNPGNPPSPELCRVYGWIYDIGGDSLADVSVTAEIPTEYQPIKYGNVIITPFRKTAITDSTGYWQLDIFPNSLLSNPLSKYQFSVEYPSGVVLRSKVAVPDTVSWQFR